MCIRDRSIMRSFSVTSANIAISDISLKTTFFGIHFCRRLYRSTFDHFDVIGPSSYRIRRKTQHNGHCGVQGHSRSPILVPIESPYATFLSVINTNLHPILHRFEVITDYWSNLRFWGPLWRVGGRVQRRLIGKRIVDFLLVIIELFSLAVMLVELRANIDWKAPF